MNIDEQQFINPIFYGWYGNEDDKDITMHDEYNKTYIDKEILTDDIEWLKLG